MPNPEYRITPSLLNSYQNLLDFELLYDKFYGFSEEPALTLEEFYNKQEQELFDAVNRVPREPIEAADKGTCLNEIVDCILEHRPPQNGIVLKTVRDPEGRPQHINAALNGFSFNFDYNLCMGLAGYFRGSTCQHLCEATIETFFGPVIIYGYADYICRDVVKDLKSTANYTYGNYEKGWQKVVYPWALIESGELQAVSGFEYTVAKLTGGSTRTPIITGEIYKEWYDYDHEIAGNELRGILESFIAWIELNREKITHPRIFNK